MWAAYQPADSADLPGFDDDPGGCLWHLLTDVRVRLLDACCCSRLAGLAHSLSPDLLKAHARKLVNHPTGKKIILHVRFAAKKTHVIVKTHFANQPTATQ